MAEYPMEAINVAVRNPDGTIEQLNPFLFIFDDLESRKTIKREDLIEMLFEKIEGPDPDYSQVPQIIYYNFLTENQFGA